LIIAITYTAYQAYYCDIDSAYINCLIEQVSHIRDEFMGIESEVDIGELSRECINENMLTTLFVDLKLYTLARRHKDTGIATYINDDTS
jgi:hypothetical protein